MTIKEKILTYLDYKGVKKTDFFETMGIAPSNFKGAAKQSELGSDKVAKILAMYDDLSPDWLLTDRGEMLKADNIALPATKAGEGIPLIPIDALAGTLQGESVIDLAHCERYVVPIFNSAEFLIHVKGDSMQPRYFSGDMIACKNIPLADIFFQWGKVYVIDTDQGALIKKVEQGSTDETILLVSENANYKPFEIKRNSIHHISLVLGLIRAE